MKFVSPFEDTLNMKESKKNKNGKVRYEMLFDPEADKDILDYLDQFSNKAERIREILREKINSL